VRIKSQMLEVATILKGPDPFGHVPGGIVRLKGCIAPITPVFQDVPLDPAVYTNQTPTRLAILDGTEYGRYIGLLALDISTLFGSLDDSCLYNLKMWRFQEQSLEILEDNYETWQRKLLGLGLELVDANRVELERIGLAHIRPEAEDGSRTVDMKLSLHCREEFDWFL
jgi:hypothetical protein